MDSLSIAGFTLTAINTFLKVSEKTAELISNVHDFDHDTQVLETRIRDDNVRTRALRQLLFDPSSIYHGRTLFELFNPEVQGRIQLSLEQANSIIEQAYQLLRRQRAVSPAGETGAEDDIPSSSTLSINLLLTPSRGSGLSPSYTHGRSKKPSRTFRRIQWSLLDKERAEAIVRDFCEMNKRIYDNIELWCLSTPAGVGLQHLKRLESNTNSQVLGFDIDATLRLAVRTEENSPRTFEIPRSEKIWRALLSVVPVESKFGITQWNSKPMLVEYRSYAPESPVSIDMDARTHDAVNRLAKLLHQPKNAVFRAPSCYSWVRQVLFNRVVFMFSIPEGSEPRPRSLYHILGSGSPPPALGQRFALALQLARCISHLQLVQWAHGSFRSENILFFPPNLEDSPELRGTPQEHLNFSEPWVLGYGMNQPKPYFSRGRSDGSYDVYCHPERQEGPTRFFKKIYDIYALGVVLLEIGLWQQATSLEKSGFARVRDPYAIKKQLVRNAEKRLASKMGERYKQVVVKCLENGFGVGDDSKEDLKLQQAFRSQVIDALEDATKHI
ncbi:hypothetical protein F4811DRAFT_520533 [Daldinia bambusicola]|nr:hypothetical protein F4811DRAFT_520533 [Daldinia bambusicola]